MANLEFQDDPNLPLQTARAGDWSVVRVTEVSLMDAAVIDRLSAAVAGRVESGEKNLVLDMSEVEYISSSAVGFLVEINQHVSRAKGQLVLAGLNDRLAELLKITKLDKMFKREKTLGDAMQRLK